MVFRTLRRAERAISWQDAWAVVERASYGVLSLTGDGGYPYGVPLTHAVIDGTLVFHAAREGHKLDALRVGAKACYTVVEGPLEPPGQELPPDCLGTYQSAILFGKMVELPQSEYERVLRAICARHTPRAERQESVFLTGYERLSILCFQVEHISGKRLPVR